MLRNKLKSFRFKYEMNQTEFRIMLGVNKDQYNKWENQKYQPSLEWCWKISKKLNCHIEELFEMVPSDGD